MPELRSSKKKKAGHDPALAEARSHASRFLERFFNEFWTEPTEYPQILKNWSPAVDVSEDATEIVVKAEIPGMAAGDIQVTVTGDVLKLAGQKKEEKRDKAKDYYRLERRFGFFERILKLPALVDSESVTANCENGVLRLRMPKLNPVEPRKVKVEVK